MAQDSKTTIEQKREQALRKGRLSPGGVTVPTQHLQVSSLNKHACLGAWSPNAIACVSADILGPWPCGGKEHADLLMNFCLDG